MAKRRLLQWMREQLSAHANKVVIPVKEKRALEAAYAKAEPLVLAVVAKRYPAADMKVLAKYECASPDARVKLQFPNGVVTEFEFEKDRGPITANTSSYGRIFLTDAKTAEAVEKWETTRDDYAAERKRRLAAYAVLIAGAGHVEEVIEAWPEAKGILPAGSPPIPLGPEQIALVRADQKERAAA